MFKLGFNAVHSRGEAMVCVAAVRVAPFSFATTGKPLIVLHGTPSA